ncbi:serine/threonine protein kinase [Archangium gephyra]|uniref:Serine/threonine protein kinase n=1 Tax=Archangium gephyra TaxID=48 RepID=A0AAC8TI80_9BACT|nr:serine/threonine-protein kinase [Archangium gephyra]AKJ06540.1 serine/threonine protein kinase [Archangium gephyra]REG32146.1 serine/threonine protein kinase [Archangium gephyra]
MTTTQPKRQPIPFGKYLLLDRINIGGMAEVWRGKMFGAGGFERLVAIKRILPNIAEDDEFISMFIDEAKISVQLNHANIAQIYELGQITNSYFIAMEYIPGRDMRAIFDRCRKKGEPAPVPLVAYVVSKMCEGLDYAHRKKTNQGQDLNIVHRDISPQNILISFEGEVKVIDFGIAKAAGKATKTQAGILKGKFGYMSPEQIRGLPLDRRSDIFAIGVCLYEMLTGERLFVGDSDFSVLEKVRKAEVAPPSTYNRRIPEALEKIVLKALARDVDERYQYANELGDDLQRFLLTSDSIFGRKDLMQYMKSTFAEDVEREKQRLQEYADIKPPEGMLAAIEMGFSGASSAPQVQVPASVPVPSQPPVSPPMPANPSLGGVRRAPTLGAMPKLTAPTPLAPPVPEEESGATMVVSSPEYLEEPTTQPGLVGPGRTVTPVEVPRPPVIDEQPAQRMAAMRSPGLAAPPRPSIPTLSPAPPSAESTTVARQGRNTMDGLRAVRPEPPVAEPPVVPRASLAAMPAVAAPRSSPPAPPPPLLEEPESQDAMELTPATPLRAAAAAQRGAPAAAPPPAAAPARVSEKAAPSRMPLIAGLAVVLLLVAGAAGFFMSRPVPMGYIMVNVPDVKAPVRVSFGGQELDTSKLPVLQQVKAGPALVMVSAEGYHPFTQQVDITEGMTPFQLEVKLERKVRMARLVIVTQPADAELKVDGKVVREKGSSSPYLDERPEGTEVAVEASAPGFKPKQERLTLAVDGKPMDLKLEADGFEVEVASTPSGATIFASGKEVGTTPKRVRLENGVKQVSLKLRCHDDAEVEVAPGSGQVKGRLKKQRGCK